jgi:hypothetical protein
MRRLGYLIRAGLGIPDYWHPRLEIRGDFESGRIGRYPVSMECKAEYPGQLNAEGVPVIFLGTIPTVLPVAVILYGLGSYDAFLQTANLRYRDQTMRALCWLKNRSVALGEGIGWPNREDIPVYGLQAPWFSAVAQGFALSLLVRANDFDSGGPWRAMACAAWRGYHVPIEAGGFSRKMPYGVVYEEYPAAQLNFVFNGMCHAVIGLWEAWKSHLVAEAEEDFHNGINAVRFLLPRFVEHNWSLYSLSECLGKPLLASPYYQRANGLLAKVIAVMANDLELARCGQCWLNASDSVVRRVAISLRIGLDRFFAAPELLHTDKAQKI